MVQQKEKHKANKPINLAVMFLIHLLCEILDFRMKLEAMNDWIASGQAVRAASPSGGWENVKSCCWCHLWLNNKCLVCIIPQSRLKPFNCT